MDIKSMSEAKKLLAERRNIALEKLENSRRALLENAQYAELTKQIKLNTLALSRALANDQDCTEFEQKDEELRAELEQMENKLLDKKQFFTCQKCEDSGIVNGGYCDCLLEAYKRILRQKSSASTLPSFTFADNEIAKLNCKQSSNLAKLYGSMSKYCDQFPNNDIKSILLCGKVGVGKSCLLSAILNKMLDKGVNCQYYTAFELNSLFLKYHTTDIKQREYLMENLIGADLLIIDDLGTEPIMKNVSIEYLTLLLNERANKNNIVATNLTAIELQEKYGDRVFSRLTNKATTKLLLLDGDDLRHIK